MSTLRQLIQKKSRRIKKMTKSRARKLDGCPQKKGTVRKIFETSPKKPNSARRKMLQVECNSNKKMFLCSIPGSGHNLHVNAEVLVRGGRCRDVIAARYKPIRNKYDLGPVLGRTSRKSKYGIAGVSTKEKKALKGKKN